MGVRNLASASAISGSKSNKFVSELAPRGAMEVIADYTWVDGGSTGGGFSNIPQTYQDLMIVFSGTCYGAGGTTMGHNMNNETGTPWSYTTFFGTGTGVMTSGRASNTTYFPPVTNGIGYGGNAAPSLVTYHILNYTSTTNAKTFLVRYATDQSGSGSVGITAGTCRVTNALTSFTWSTANGSIFFTPGSTMTLYGIRAGA